MNCNPVSLERNLGSLRGDCRLRKKQAPIKPLASVARDFNDDDAVDCETNGTTNSSNDWHLQVNCGGSMRVVVMLTVGLLMSPQYIIEGMATGFSLDISPRGAKNIELARYDPSESLMQVLSSDCSNEFTETSLLLMFMKEALEQYRLHEQLNPTNEDMKVHPVSVNLVRVGVNLGDEHQVQRIASELDFVMSTFWNEFFPLIHRIVTEKPQELNPSIDLAFRCARYPELMTLSKLSNQSTLYSLLWQVFTTELYIHCVRRKLTTLDLTQVKPSSAVRQFVDIYIDFPVHYSAMLMQNTITDEERLYATKLLALMGLQFSLDRSLANNGPLQSAAHLVFNTDSQPLSLGFSDTSSSSQRLVDRFRMECMDLTAKLGKVWGDLDEAAALMSSPMNDLAEFSRRIKLAAPQLIYGSVCGQLIQTIKG